jgi:hypothetical protein
MEIVLASEVKQFIQSMQKLFFKTGEAATAPNLISLKSSKMIGSNMPVLRGRFKRPLT